MWFMECVLILFSLMGITFLAGQPLVLLFSRHNKIVTVDKFCLSLLLGTFTISYLFFLGSYCNIPGKFLGPIIVLLIICSLYLLNKQTILEVKIKSILQFNLVCLAAIIISLLPLLIFDSFNPHNDTIAYISLSDYLQNNGFLKTITDNTGFHALDTIGRYFQLSRARMGANFFLAAIQSIFKADKALFIFPVAQTWGIVLNLAAMVVALRWMFQTKWHYIVLTLCLVAITSNPLYYSAHNGFNNSLYGSAYFVLVLATFLRFLRCSNSQDVFRFLLLSAFSLASLIIFYPELFPFAFIALTLSSFLPVIREKRNVKRWFLFLVLFTFITIIISNISFIGMYKSFLMEFNSIVGENIQFNLLEFFYTALGFVPFRILTLSGYIIDSFFILLFLFGVYKISEKKMLSSCTWSMGVLVFIIGFFYFFLFVGNPWEPNRMGQTWSMFKIAKWSYPTFIMGVGYALSKISPRKITIALMILLVVYVNRALYTVNFEIAKTPRLLTKSNHPFEGYRQLANDIKKLETDQPIELALDSLFLTEMVSYFLNPIPYFSDWRDNPHMVFLENKFKNIDLKKRHYIVTNSNKILSSNAKPLFANISLLDSTTPYIRTVTGLSGEGITEKTLNKSSGNAEILFTSDKDQSANIHFNILSAIVPTKIEIIIAGNKPIILPIEKRSSIPVDLTAYIKKGINSLSIRSSASPVKIVKDPRWFSFAISSLKIALVGS